MQLQRDQIGSWRGPILCWKGQCDERYPQICYFLYVFTSLCSSWSQLFQYFIIDWLIPIFWVQIQVKSPLLSHRNRLYTDQPLKRHKSLQETPSFMLRRRIALERWRRSLILYALAKFSHIAEKIWKQIWIPHSQAHQTLPKKCATYVTNLTSDQF